MSEQLYQKRSLEIDVYPHLNLALEMVDASLPKIAVDVGCGSGRDSLFLVGRGFTVYAFDKSESAICRLRKQRQEHSGERLFSQICSFEDFKYPQSSLVTACSSLFFCHPKLFSQVWSSISRSLLTGGVFCGHFMGPNDSWAKLNRGDLTVHKRSDLEDAFSQGYEIADVYEHDAKGATLAGAEKHWHTYSVVAIKVGD